MSDKTKVTKNKASQKAVANQEIGAGARVLTAQELELNESHQRSIAPQAFAVYVRTLRQNWRQGTVAAKGRSDVSFSNKKPWRQKGTGRARAGSARSPLWRKGGVCHGPQPRTRMLKTMRNVKQSVMNKLFWDYLNRGSIIVLDNKITANKPQTNVAHKMLKDAGLHNKKVIVFVRSDDMLTRSSFANIGNVNTLLFDQANAFDLSHAPQWIVLSQDIAAFKNMVGSWL
jgi:large subunit ribosomal protein L4